KVQLVDARQFWVPMDKSLGQKRRQIGDGDEGRPDQISIITQIYGEFIHDDTRTVPVNGGEKELVVSKITNISDRQHIDKDLPGCYLFSINSIQHKGANHVQNRPVCQQI
ncbi:MAG TPA: hypothetical protein VKN82_09955, partial [Desulfohalobiaceae bacterium]|nr:hypothetical protein [Desulfohalobiaceae bacterium]